MTPLEHHIFKKLGFTLTSYKLNETLKNKTFCRAKYRMHVIKQLGIRKRFPILFKETQRSLPQF